MASKIAEIMLLLQRSLKHLQMAPQNTLDPDLFTSVSKDVRSRHQLSSFDQAPLKFICTYLCESPLFYQFMIAITFMSTVLLSLQRYDQPTKVATTISILDGFLVIVFILEAYIKVSTRPIMRHRSGLASTAVTHGSLTSHVTCCEVGQ